MGDPATDASRAEGALPGLRVVDLSDDVAGQFCARLFADNGAEVVLVEPPPGSAMRGEPPMVEVGEDRRSAFFSHLNRGKRGFVEPRSEPDRAAVRELIEGSDVVVTGEADRATGLLSGRVGPRVVCDITAFGRDGVRPGWRGDELVFQALSGTMFENGLPGRAPLYGVGRRASYAAGAIGYVQALAALRQGGTRRRVDVAIAEVAASMSFSRATQYGYNGTVEGRDARTTPRAIARCTDGWVAVFIYDHRWRESCRALGLERLLEDPRFGSEEERLYHWEQFVAELQGELADRRVDDVVDAGQRAKVVVARATSPRELYDDPQLRARGFWEGPSDGSLPVLGPMFRFAVTPQPDPSPAPPASGTPEPRWTRLRRPSVSRSPRGRRHLPLEDVVVLDLTTAWSGPMATRILGALGAEVLKVEGPGRIDDWRGPVEGGQPSRYPDLDPGERPYDRCFQFNTQNHDKHGVALDLKTDAGRRLALDLAAGADVAIANFSAGTLDRMGLGWERLREVNPDLILLEMPAYGEGGPLDHHVALGPSMELMAGMASLIGYGDGRPTTTGPAYLDPIGGFNAAAAILTAILARDAGRGGQRIELAQREAAMHWIGEEIVAAIAAGKDRPVAGNRIEAAAPHGAFRCLGEDEWVAIGVRTGAEFDALCGVLGLDAKEVGLADAGLAERARCEDRIEAAVEERTRGRDKHELAAELQAAGVSAAPVCDARDVSEDRFLDSRGLLQALDHPAAGRHRYQGLPLHIEGLDLSISSPAPTFGQHTEAVLAERLGTDRATLAQLREEDVIATSPRRPGEPRRVLAATDSGRGATRRTDEID